jgi:uncharacterized membrane protein
MNADDLLARVEVVESRVRLLQREVDEIRRELRTEQTPEPVPTRAPAPAPLRTVSEPFPAPRAASQAPPPPAQPRTPRREIDLSELFGPQALAWAGGVVTLLGVVFFFILAVDNGWIGPAERVAFGAGASALVFGAGLWLRRRFGETYSSLAAVGAGIAGGYATLAASTVLYDLVPSAVALVVAAAIAGASLAVALAWDAELVAALGLVGAIAAPALLAVQGGISAGGTAFAAIATAAAAAVAIRRRWRGLLVAAAVASAPQIVALILTAGTNDAGAIALAIVFALLYLATGIAEQLATGDEALELLPTSFVLGSIALAWLGAAQLFGPAGGSGAGSALLVASAGFGAVTAGLWLRSQRELATLLGAMSLAAAAVGVADLLSGASLAYTFAGEAAVLAVAARRVREPRLQLAAGAYFALAAGHALAFDAPPSALFEPARHPAAGAGALAAAAVAAFVVARLTGNEWNGSTERGLLSFLAPVVGWLRARQRAIAVGGFVTAAVLTVDALSLVVLELAEALWSDAGIDAAFHRGHVALTMLWSLAGLVAVAIGARRRSTTVCVAAFAWLGLTALKVATYDAVRLDGVVFSLSFLAIATALLLAGYLREVLEDRASLGIESAAAVAAAGLYATASLVPTGSLHDAGLGMLAIALVYALFASTIFTQSRLRDLTTTLWACGAVVAAVALPLLVHGTFLTLAWTGGAVLFSVLAVYAREDRFVAPACVYIVLAAEAAFQHAPPSHLVVAHEHPARGLLDLLLVVVSLSALAWATTRAKLDARLSHGALWAAAVVTVYAASLGILELSVRISGGSLHTGFQRGHTGVSALWGILGLALLYAGLRRSSRALRVGGFALLAISVGKLFFYDLSQLSSVTRALSFLAVGALLLLGGFFTQRLTAERGPTSSAAR